MTPWKETQIAFNEPARTNQIIGIARFSLRAFFHPIIETLLPKVYNNPSFLMCSVYSYTEFFHSVLQIRSECTVCHKNLENFLSPLMPPKKRNARETFTYQHQPETPAVRRKTTKEILDASMSCLSFSLLLLVCNTDRRWTGTADHNPLPSPERDDGENDQATQPSSFAQHVPDSEEEKESGETQSWFDRVQERLGAGVSPSGVLRLSRDSDEPKPQVEPGLRASPGTHQVCDAPSTLANLQRQTSAIADSVNIIDHQFKLQVLARLGSLEKEVRELEAKMQRTYDACRGIELKLNNRKGAPCDVIERLDSMVNFTYAFCKSMEDAGVFRLQKRNQ